MIREELIRLFRMLFEGDLEFIVKTVRSQKASGVIYIPKRYKRRIALVLFLKNANKGTNPTG